MDKGKGKTLDPELINSQAAREITDALPALKEKGQRRKALPVGQSSPGFTRSTATWLSLFTANNADRSPEDARSHTIELADAIPFYHYGHQPGPEIKALERRFVNRNREYLVTVLPATLEDRIKRVNDGVDDKKSWTPRFPAEREALVFEAVKLLASQNAELLDGNVGVGFTLSAAKRLLKETGHDMSISQIKAALQTMQRCTIIVKDASGKNVIEESIIKSLMFSKRGTRDLCFVQFNSFTTEAIRAGQYRGLKYQVVARYQSIFARWLYKQMSHYFTQASEIDPYEILASTALRNAGLFLSATPNSDGIYLCKKPNKWAKCIIEGLDEMLQTNSEAFPAALKSYAHEPIRRGGYVKDYKFCIFASPAFIKDIKVENARIKYLSYQL